jgi:hypothetical protein
MMMKFSFIRNVYRWSHSHFDMDFLIICCLINESIALGQFNVQEYTMMKAIINKRLKLFEEQEEKRKREQALYRKNKKRRLFGSF